VDLQGSEGASRDEGACGSVAFQPGASDLPLEIQQISVERIRPEDGLGRKRDRDGHAELRQSIQEFGVLTPITVRLAPGTQNDYLLIKGQGRTLACRMLGIETVPAIVVDGAYADSVKVQQFLVENVARLRMRPVDRALLITRARQSGEETLAVARRFGVSPATVRKLEAQLDGANNREVAALKSGKVNLSTHAVVARYVPLDERPDVVGVLSDFSLRARDVEEIFRAVGWSRLVSLGPEYGDERLLLLAWVCSALASVPHGQLKDRLAMVAEQMPSSFSPGSASRRVVDSR
jgi:ParB/RepB/Spo0J family partition protein